MRSTFDGVFSKCSSSVVDVFYFCAGFVSGTVTSYFGAITIPPLIFPLLISPDACFFRRNDSRLSRL